MSAPKDAILNKALELENKDIADRNITRVRSQMAVISSEKTIIAQHEKNIAEAQKLIKSYSATPELTSKDVLG